MISKNIEKALQQQIALEAYSSAYYLSMASWMDVEGFEGTAAFLYKQSDEERMHMLKILHFINDNDGHAVVPQMDAPPVTFENYHNCFQRILEQEQSVTASIHSLVNMSLTEKDHAANNFLQWYVFEQIEEEKQVKTILNKLKIIGNDGPGLYLLDNELGKLAGPVIGVSAADGA
ncbi:MAG: ferritin [Bacteroidetes bacterium]|nr:ferritin [Bacteroidota bacterium]